MLSCFMNKCMMVMTRATLMSTRLCRWGTVLIFNWSCGGCHLLVVSCQICIKTRLCSLREVRFCTDQAAENIMSSVKATLSKGSHAELSIGMPPWNAVSLPRHVASSGCMALLRLAAPSGCFAQAQACGPEKANSLSFFPRNFLHQVRGSMLMSSLMC